MGTTVPSFLYGDVLAQEMPPYCILEIHEAVDINPEFSYRGVVVGGILQVWCLVSKPVQIQLFRWLPLLHIVIILLLCPQAQVKLMCSCYFTLVFGYPLIDLGTINNIF